MSIEKHVTLFQRMAPVESKNSLLFWAGVSVTLIIISVIISRNMGNYHPAFLSICIYLSIGYISVPLGIAIGYGVLHDWALHADHFAKHKKPDVATWFHMEIAVIQGDWITWLCGCGFGLLSLVAFYAGGYFETYTWIPGLYLSMIMFGSAGFAGMGLYAILYASRIFWRLGNLDKLSLKVHEHRFGVLSIGTALFKCWMIIGIIWAAYTATAFVGYTGVTPDKIFGLPPMWLLAYPTLPLIIGSFVVCQIPLHRKMVAFKQAEILRLDQMLDAISPVDVSELIPEIRSNITFLENQKAQVRALPDWPSSKVSLLGTGVSSFTALLPMLLSKDFPEWGKQLVAAIL